jgi:hypothetical protein
MEANNTKSIIAKKIRALNDSFPNAISIYIAIKITIITPKGIMANFK